MCPDRQLISLLVDGELPSPWKEKLESHLSSCPSCENVAEDYRNLSRVLESIPVEHMEEARARVWNTIVHTVSAERAPSAWKRRLILPVPAAIAAMLAVALIAAGGVSIATGSRNKQESIAVIQTPKTAAVPVSDMSSVLRYLESQDSSGDILIIRLPDNSNFAYKGQPTLIKAADYSGRPLP
ncbi:MAG: zf-HC2 domain-containing protein [Treponemataceae bacterium]